MRQYSSFNRGYHYILTVIDVLSKYAWAIPLKSKGESETLSLRSFERAKNVRKIYKRLWGKNFIMQMYRIS